MAAQTVLSVRDEVAWLQQRLQPLVGQAGNFTANDVPNLWVQWLQNGGWWTAQSNLAAPETAPAAAAPAPGAPLADGEYYLITQGTFFGDGSGANRPWLQETPHPLTTVMWGSWVQIHPETAAKLGVTDDDVVKLSSPAGEVEASVYLFPAIRPDTVAVPFGQGHTALGQFAAGRGFNPAALFGAETSEAAGPAYADVRVRITPTGQKKPLARLESRLGVYGVGNK
jgi:formylmethanofuran dehydrogenase subunit D